MYVSMLSAPSPLHLVSNVELNPYSALCLSYPNIVKASADSIRFANVLIIIRHNALPVPRCMLSHSSLYTDHSLYINSFCTAFPQRKSKTGTLLLLFRYKYRSKDGPKSPVIDGE